MFVIACDYISPTCTRMASSIPCCQGNVLSNGEINGLTYEYKKVRSANDSLIVNVDNVCVCLVGFNNRMDLTCKNELTCYLIEDSLQLVRLI